MKKIVYPIFLSFVVGLTITSANATDSIASARMAVLDGSLQSQLQTQLKRNDYNNFYSNLEDFSAPYTLKNGSIFYEARRDNLNAASAIVVDPQGYFYVAYKIPNSNSITYITNDGGCNKEVHDAIKVFANTFEGNNKIIFSNPTKTNNTSHSCKGVYGNRLLKSQSFERAYSNESTAQQETRRSAESIWSTSITNNWNMNEELADVVGTTVNAIRTCSANFSLVPKPPAYGPIPGLSYFAKYASQVIKYNSGLQASTTYRTCVVSAARNFRTAAELASMGI